MTAIDIVIMICAFIVVILMFLQPLSQDKLAGFLSGSLDMASTTQKVKERGSTKLILNLTIFMFFLIIILLIVARTL